MKFLHISDLHYHRSSADNVEADRLLETIRNRYPKHYLIVTGDITDDGHPEQYENACAALKPFVGRLSIVPGNHDFGAAGNLYSRERAVRFDEMLARPLGQGGTFQGDSTPVVTIAEDGGDRVMVIGLDSNLETNHPFDFACGEIGSAQLSALARILENPATVGLPKLVCLHHHPFMHNNPFMMLTDARELARTIFGRVDAVLFGHKHVWEQWDNFGSVKHYLASDNSPGKDWARELTVGQGGLEVKSVDIKPTPAKKKPKDNG